MARFLIPIALLLGSFMCFEAKPIESVDKQLSSIQEQLQEKLAEAVKKFWEKLVRKMEEQDLIRKVEVPNWLEQILGGGTSKGKKPTTETYPETTTASDYYLYGEYNYEAGNTESPDKVESSTRKEETTDYETEEIKDGKKEAEDINGGKEERNKEKKPATEKKEKSAEEKGRKDVKEKPSTDDNDDMLFSPPPLPPPAKIKRVRNVKN